MNGLSCTFHDDILLREQLSLEIIRRRDFANIGSEGLDTSRVPISGVARRFGNLRLVASESPVVNGHCQFSGLQNALMAYVRSTVPATHQFSVTNVDEQGHVLPSPVVTIPWEGGTHLRRTSNSDLLHNHCSIPAVTPVNHAFLCMDVGSCAIGPQMVDLSNCAALQYYGVSKDGSNINKCSFNQLSNIPWLNG